MNIDVVRETPVINFWRVFPKPGIFEFDEFRALLHVLDRLGREMWITGSLTTKIDFFEKIPAETLAQEIVPPHPTIFDVREMGIYASTPAISMLPEVEFKRAVFIRVRMRPRERPEGCGEVVVDMWKDKPHNVLVYLSFKDFDLYRRRDLSGYLNEFLWTPIK